MKTRCVFRQFKDDGHIIALLGTIGLPDCNPGIIMSYMHVGQHSEADPGIIKCTWPVKIHSGSVQALIHELTAIGYDLDIKQRLVR